MDFPLDAIVELVSTCMEIGMGAKDDFTILVRVHLELASLVRG